MIPNRSVDAANLTAPPQTSDFTYTNQRRYYSYSLPSNGSRINKKGIEYQLSTKRFKGINTRFTINGAWFSTTYVNSMTSYALLSGLQVPEEQAGQFVATYDADAASNYLREQLNTNLTIDSYLPKLGLIISTSLQNLWFTSLQVPSAESLPTSYMDINGKVFPYTKQSQLDPALKLFDRMYNYTSFRKRTVPLDLQVNLKVTKEFKKTAAISMFVNRLLTYTPDYTAYGVTFTRQAFISPYFGMELNLKF
ncbi:hypothetical protein [Paraflavitalea pollutisoli]|uniref:hypothetical protein n=1 Tax=Paraflavitalea pollutisoli TaxID=3034143 RepID=UPI0023ED608D|nr:hypothetical protein [Paraflavitalea sp. H1-2-19X]